MAMLRILFAALVLFVAIVNIVAARQAMDEAAQLMQADRDFDLATARHRLDGWVSFFAPNGSMIADTLPPVTGPAAVRKRMAPAFADTTFVLRWNPVRAEMLIPGNIGCTVGRYERFKRDSTGVTRRETGTYTTVWKKQPDGSWKVVLDTGEADK